MTAAMRVRVGASFPAEVARGPGGCAVFIDVAPDVVEDDQELRVITFDEAKGFCALTPSLKRLHGSIAISAAEVGNDSGLGNTSTQAVSEHRFSVRKNAASIQGTNSLCRIGHLDALL